MSLRQMAVKIGVVMKFKMVMKSGFMEAHCIVICTRLRLSTAMLWSTHIFLAGHMIFVMKYLTEEFNLLVAMQ